ncbi:hypothetical protein BOQ00_03440 [Campylobacter coli]|nr:hypothetical protein BOQ00_03440 [Campylobacter coli]
MKKKFDSMFYFDRYYNFLHISSKYRYIYYSLAKNACTTIKHTLQYIEDKSCTLSGGGVHQKGESPLLFLDNIDYNINIDQYFKFAFVRNPYVRILSCYLDKIKRNTPYTDRYYNILKIKRDPSKGYIEFIDFLNELYDGKLFLDQHWAPQSYYLPKDLGLDYIGKVENLNEELDYVLNVILKINDSIITDRPHMTNSNEQLKQYIGKKEQELIYEMYYDDFVLFGYSEDFNDLYGKNLQRYKDDEKYHYLIKYVNTKYDLKEKLKLLSDKYDNKIKSLEHASNKLNNVCGLNQIIKDKDIIINTQILELKRLQNYIKYKDGFLVSKDNLLFFLSKHGTAKSRIQNQLSYKLGQAMIVNSKSLLGYIRMPFVLSYIKDKHKQEQKIYQEKIKKDPSLKLPPLESYPDYKEALKEKECLTYKLGEALIRANNNWYGGGVYQIVV